MERDFANAARRSWAVVVISRRKMSGSLDPPGASSFSSRLTTLGRRGPRDPAVGPAGISNDSTNAGPPSGGMLILRRLSRRSAGRLPRSSSDAVSSMGRPICSSTLGGTKSPKGRVGYSDASGGGGGRLRRARFNSASQTTAESMIWSSVKPMSLTRSPWKKPNSLSIGICRISSANKEQLTI